MESPSAAGIRRRRRARVLRTLEPYLLITPTVVYLTAFLGWPTLSAMSVAFRTLAGAWTLDNFQRMVRDTDFGLSARNTLLIMAIVIPLELILALGMMVIAQTRLRGRALVMYLWSIPLATSDLTAGLVWLSIFTEHGYLNSALQRLHLISHPVGFLDYNDVPGLVLAVVLAETWRSVSLVMVVIMSGAQMIPANLNEAAITMGASVWRRFWHLTLPLLKPTIQVALILRTTLAFQVFAVVLTMTGSGLPVLATRIQAHAYEARNYQLAAAYAVLLLLMSSLSTVLYLVVLRTPRPVFGT